MSWAMGINTPIQLILSRIDAVYSHSVYEHIFLPEALRNIFAYWYLSVWVSKTKRKRKKMRAHLLSCPFIVLVFVVRFHFHFGIICGGRCLNCPWWYSVNSPVSSWPSLMQISGISVLFLVADVLFDR